MMGLIVYGLLSAAMFYLGSRALVTQSLWIKYPPWLAKFMDCSACTGFWWGLVWALTAGRLFMIDVGPFGFDHPATPILVGLCMLVLTPMIAGLMQAGLDRLGSAVAVQDDL